MDNTENEMLDEHDFSGGSGVYAERYAQGVTLAAFVSETEAAPSDEEAE